MKTFLKLSFAALLITGLSACETIDEERFANIECNDLKQLVATDNLTSLSRSEDSGLFGVSENRDSQRTQNLFDLSDEDRKRQAELRAAYRNNCG